MRRPWEPLRRESVGVPIIPLLRAQGFDDDQTEMLGAAFDTAWQLLSTRDPLLKQQPAMGAARELLAKLVIEEGSKGELRPSVIVDRAVDRFDQLKSA